MSLECVYSEKDEYNRTYEVYYDTDDLNQEQYYEYCKLKNQIKTVGDKDKALKYLISNTK